MRLNALSTGIATPRHNFHGVIHSSFQRACNIILEDNSLVTLLSSEFGNLPQGIRVSLPPEFTFKTEFRRGQSAACRGGILRVEDSDLSVDLRPAVTWHLDLTTLQIDLSRPDSARSWTVAWEELERYWQENGRSSLFMFHPSPIPPLPPRHAAHRMQIRLEEVSHIHPTLVEATEDLQIDRTISALAPLIGLGPGLTPAGDDFIVGYLAGLWSTVAGDSARLRFISSLSVWLSQAAGGTNHISHTYIDAALSGQLPEPIATLAYHLDQTTDKASVRTAAEIALHIGHSSGAEAVLGLLLGCVPWASPSRLQLTRPRSFVCP
jgi:Protein of unknown function (DUF2877)